MAAIEGGSVGALVSIVISCHNYGRFVGEAIESALGQSYSPTEVIVVDNGSCDDSREVIASFGPLVRARFQRDRGQGGGYNVGFEMSRGVSPAGSSQCCLRPLDDLSVLRVKRDTQSRLSRGAKRSSQSVGVGSSEVARSRP